MIKDFIIGALTAEILINKLPLTVNTISDHIALLIGLTVCAAIAFVFVEDLAEKALRKYNRSKRLQKKVRKLSGRN